MLLKCAMLFALVGRPSYARRTISIPRLWQAAKAGNDRSGCLSGVVRVGPDDALIRYNALKALPSATERNTLPAP